MTKRSMLISSAAVLGTAAAFSGLVFYQVMARNAKLYEKIVAALADETDPEENKKERSDERRTWFKQQKFKELSMINDRGQTLRAYLSEPEKPSDVYVLCAHGYRSNGRGEFRFNVKYYHDKGFNVLMVDHQAAGNSEGKMISFGYYESRDIIKWIEYLKENFGENIKVILHGVSMGCATVTLASGDEKLPDNVKFTVADCGFTSIKDQFKAVLKSANLPSFPLVNLTDLWNRAVSGFSFDDVRPIDSVKHAKVPFLFIHGGNDTFVPTSMVYELYDACTSEKDLLIVDGAVHARSYYHDPEACDKKLDSFIEKYIGQ